MAKLQKIIFVLIIFLAVFLRFYHLSINPPSLYWDETAFGYDAYSILKTGKDHHGQFMPLFFESFGDWKLPGYFYMLVPSIKLFGLTEFAVRFPSALLSSFTIIVLFFLVKELTKNINLALTSSLFLSISPWHIQFARGGFESSAGLFFVTFASFLFLRGLTKKKSIYFFASLVLFAFSIYTYHAYRIFTPLLILGLLLTSLKEIKKIFRIMILPFIVFLLLLLPITAFSFTQNGQARIASQSAFNKEKAEKAKIEYDQKSKKPLRFLSGRLYQKPIYYTYIAISNYIDHFSPVFLFFKGDQIGRHSQVDMGQIYAFDAVFIIFSLWGLKKINNQALKLFLMWLLLAPIPAAIVNPTPHAYRTFQMVIPLTFFSSLGAYYFFSLNRLRLVKLALFSVVIYSFFTYLHLLFVHYLLKFGPDWQDGYKQAVALVRSHEASYDRIYISKANNVPYIYFLFFNGYNPQKYLDEQGTGEEFFKYIFTDDNFDLYNKGKILYLAPAWKELDGIPKGSVYDRANRHVFNLWEIGGSN